ncbi:MAG: hypothetical protein VKJ24_21980 [Synechococcales bacterium]|nr:hypothetical protein [Synechococcales bacterium]
MFRHLLSRVVMTTAAIAIAHLPFSKPAQAFVGLEQEPNGTIEQAQNIDHLFSTGFNPDIAFSDNTGFRHATIKGTGVGTAFWDNFDFFSLTIDRAGGRGIFDIDRTVNQTTISEPCLENDLHSCTVRQNPLGFDTRLFIFDPDLVSQAFSDDELATWGGTGSVANSPLGSGLSLDPYIGENGFNFTFQKTGTYYVGVNFGALDGLLQQTGRYHLNVAVETVPEPTVLLAIAGVATYLIQRRRQG